MFVYCNHTNNVNYINTIRVNIYQLIISYAYITSDRSVSIGRPSLRLCPPLYAPLALFNEKKLFSLF